MPGSSVTAVPSNRLDAAAARLAGRGYHVVRVDCAGWRDAADMHTALSAALRFPEHYGRNLDALTDALRDVAEGEYGRPAGSTGLGLVLDGYDAFARVDAVTAHALLEVWSAAAGSAGGAEGAIADVDRPDDRLRCLVAATAA